MAEKYLVRVWAGVRSKTTAEAFDELRIEKHIVGGPGIDKSFSKGLCHRGHIHRRALRI